MRRRADSRSGPHTIELGHEVVVVLADGVARFVAGVEAHAGPTGRPERGDGAGGGDEATTGGVLGVDADLDGVAVALHLVLGEAQRLARGHPQLPLDEVEPGDQLGDGVLDLETGVHLQEVELAPFVEELDRAGVDVAARLGDGHRRLAHGAPHVVGELGGGALLDELLVAALGRAVALAEPQTVAVGVSDDLHLDVPGPFEVPLDVDLGPTEVRLGFALGRLHRLGHLVGRRHHLHAAPAAAVGGLDGDRPSDGGTELGHLGRIGDGLGPARAHPTRPTASAARRELILSPMISMASGGGPMKVTPAAVMARAKSVFSEKKPYPGCTASAPLRAMASRMASVFR